MKSLFIRSACVAIFALASSLPCRAEDSPRVITVMGEAEVKVKPDEVVIILGVENMHTDLVIAKKENDDRVKKVIAVAKENGVDPKHIQTDWIEIDPRYRRDYPQEEFIGYFVRNTVALTLKETDKLDPVLSQSLVSGANSVNGVHFRTTELRKFRDQARSMAIKAAREKAVALAKELDQGIGSPRSISEDAYYGGYYGFGRYSVRGQGTQNMMSNAFFDQGGSGGGMSESSIALGQISVSARVTVTFELK